MKRSRRDLLLALGGVVSYARFGGVRAQTNFASYSDADREALLRGGTVVSISDIGEGVTKPIRAELSWKGVTHSAQIQVVDRRLPDFFEKRQGRWRWLSLAAPTLATPPALLTAGGPTP